MSRSLPALAALLVAMGFSTTPSARAAQDKPMPPPGEKAAAAPASDAQLIASAMLAAPVLLIGRIAGGKAYDSCPIGIVEGHRSQAEDIPIERDALIQSADSDADVRDRRAL